MSAKILTYYEHEEHSLLPKGLVLSSNEYSQHFIKKHRAKEQARTCFQIHKEAYGQDRYTISTSYFIGLDWIEKPGLAISIVPKLNRGQVETDINVMLEQALQHPEMLNQVDQLLTVKWNSPSIPILQQNDVLTSFILLQFLAVLKRMVKKGLRRSYYPINKKLNTKIKGKILLGPSIKRQNLQHNQSHHFCRYDEFGLNGAENRLLKKALHFVISYLTVLPSSDRQSNWRDTINYIRPAFENVSDQIELSSIQKVIPNAFYGEYPRAIRLAKQLLQRFGYSISNTGNERIFTPPFWIDMSKLFELYVLSLLKERFHDQVKYQVKYPGNELDYLLKSSNYKMVIDAKYKTIYQRGKVNEDIRQVSGYARLQKVYEALDLERGSIIDCLIVYPDQQAGLSNLQEADLKAQKVRGYHDVYKLAVKLPVLK